MLVSRTTDTKPADSARVCAKGGCARDANGIAPFYFCSRHYVDYMEWLSNRDLLGDAIAYAESEELKLKLAGAGCAGVEFAVGGKDLQERVNRVLDLIGDTAAESIYECGAAA